jgi:thioester reductase-like protein
LARSIDAVFHAAAEVDWMKPYTGLRGPNVNGVLEVLRFCSLDRVKRLIHVSTLGVFPANADIPVVVGEEEFLGSPELLPLSYSRSKWVGEALVRGARARGLPAIICRPYYLAGATCGGVWPTTEFICRLVLSAIRTGVYCAEYAATHFVLSPVDRVSEALARIGLCDEASGAYHLAPAAATPFVAYIDAMARCGIACRPLNHLDWSRQVLSEDELLGPFSAALRVEEFPGRRGAMVSYDSRRAHALLGSAWPGFLPEPRHFDVTVTALREFAAAEAP